MRKAGPLLFNTKGLTGNQVELYERVCKPLVHTEEEKKLCQRIIYREFKDLNDTKKNLLISLNWYGKLGKLHDEIVKAKQDCQSSLNILEKTLKSFSENNDKYEKAIAAFSSSEQQLRPLLFDLECTNPCQKHCCFKKFRNPIGRPTGSQNK